MTKLRSLIQEKYLQDEERPKLPTSVKKRFVEAVSNFHRYGESIYRDTDYKKLCSELNEIIQIAEQLTLQESEHWFDNITVSRHMKQLQEAYKVFQKTALEMSGLQQRMEAAYDDMGSVLGKYYKVGESLNDGVDIEVEGDYKKKVTESKDPGELDFGSGEVTDIFNKFAKLPGITTNKSKYGTTYTYKWGTGYLMFVVNNAGIPKFAIFDNDRVHDFLQHMKSKGFGPDIFSTLEKFGRTSMNGYTSRVDFGLQEVKQFKKNKRYPKASGSDSYYQRMAKNPDEGPLMVAMELSNEMGDVSDTELINAIVSTINISKNEAAGLVRKLKREQ